MTMSVGKLFTYTQVPYGDDNQMVRGIIARCGAPGCEAAIPLPVNHLQNTRGSDDEIEWRFIARKLETKGWQIGRASETSHRCPRCAVVKSKIQPIRESQEMPTENPMSEKLKVVKGQHAGDDPRGPPHRL